MRRRLRGCTRRGWDRALASALTPKGTAALGCGFSRSMQHTNHRGGGRSVADEGRPRIYYSDSQKALMWGRWKQGWTLHEIGKLFDRPHTSIHQILAATGGFRPPQRARSPAALTLAEREEISRAMVAGESIRSTAARLGRAPSTISREIKRNGGCDGYRASLADAAAWNRARRPKTCKLRNNRALARLVAEKLRLLWAPEQIAGWLKHTYPCDQSLHVSHETIYRRPVHSSAWRLEEGAAGTPKTHARDAPLSAVHAEDGDPWADR